jgi:hypothetical protein
MKPCVFLDIDGVINPSHHQAQYKIDYSLADRIAQEKNNPKIKDLSMYLVNQVYYNFSKESIEYIHKLIEEFNAQIIITSSWRIIYPLEDLQTMFDIFGLGKYVTGTTDRISPRTKAIEAFIKKNNVTEYVILDDFDMSQTFDYRFIYVQYYFKEKDYQAAKYALTIQKGDK